MLKESQKDYLVGREFLRGARETGADNIIIFLNGCCAEAFLVAKYNYMDASVLNSDEATPQSLGSASKLLTPQSTSESEFEFDSVQLSKKTMAVFCACKNNESAQYPCPKRLGKVCNSYFVRFLINGIEGGEACFNPGENKDTGPCDICKAFAKKMSVQVFMQLSDLVDYVRQHVHVHPGLPKPRFHSVGDGEQLKMTFVRKR